MLKDFLFKVVTPITCMLATASAPISLSADQYYSNTECCGDPCQPDPCCQTSCGVKWGAFAGAAAVGVIAGVVAGNLAANSHKSHGKTGPTGPAGTNGTNGPAGTGITVATVPPNQPNAGDPITSLTFFFRVRNNIVANVDPTTSIQLFVTTPDGRTVLGDTINGLANNDGSVTITGGPFYSGIYEVGLIMHNDAVPLSSFIEAQVQMINGVVGSPTFDFSAILTNTGALSNVDTIFSSPYPFPETPTSNPR